MALNNDLISQFAKITKDENSVSKDFTSFGTIIEYEGGKYVQLDGSDVLTPISSTTNIKAGERVIVMLKNHSAIVTGNLTSPAASNADVESVGGKVTAFENVFASRVDAGEINAVEAYITRLEAGDVKIHGLLYADDALIKDLVAENATITGKLEATDANIESLHANVVVIKDVLMADKASIEDLQADFAEIEEALIEKLSTKYANIDFANIGKATMEYFYANSGLIKDVSIGDATISGHLVGVTISGDLIEGNTIVAEKLVIKGDDGLYYKLNTDGMQTVAEQTDYNSLNGSIIRAKTITATQIDVKDLVAFDATIGGFKITDNAVHSVVKETVDNTTRGIYMDNEGQMVVGDETNYIKFHEDTEDERYKLEISADSVMLGSGGARIEIKSAIDSNSSQLDDVKSNVSSLHETISSLVTGKNGESLMTQTDTGWTFSIANVLNSVESAMSDIKNVSDSVDNTNALIDALNQSVVELGEYTEYIHFGVENDKPCIILGETDSDFKVVITNTDIRFMQGTQTPASITNQALNIGTAVVNEELRQGGFAWIARSNGNYGLVWKG